MLAALLATRHVVPPPPPAFFYTNQFIAAVTTFNCITIAQKAAYTTTDLSLQFLLGGNLGANLSASFPGQGLFYYQLTREYRAINSQRATNDPVFLSASIAQALATALELQQVILTMPVASSSLHFLAVLQKRMAEAIAIFYSLRMIVV